MIGLLISTVVFSQTSKPIFVGIQPAVTKEKFYTEKEFDINVVPLVFQIPLCKQMDLRIGTLANYHFGGEKQQFSDIGFQLVAPVFLKAKEETNLKSFGFYAAPVLGLGRNLVNEHYTTTVAAEAGYMFEATKRFTLSMGLQLGGSYFTYDNLPNKWVQHFGYKINLGFWI